MFMTQEFVCMGPNLVAILKYNSVCFVYDNNDNNNVD